MSRRFAASVYKNALPSPPDKQLWYHDLPLSSDDPNAVRASSSWIIAASSSVGGLVAIGWNDTGKTTDTKRGGEWNALGGKIWALDVVEDGDGQTTVMVGGQGGFRIWSLASSTSADAFEPKLVLSISTPTAVQTAAFHPTTPSIVLTTTASTVSIWDITSSSPEPVIALEPFSPKGLWDAAWSWDGREVAATAKDGSIGLWTPRTSTKATVSLPQHLAIKPSAIVSLGNDVWLSTGFSKSRERWFLLLGSRDLSQPISTTRIDGETAPLWPVVDVPRRIVYLAGKGESTLRSYEVSATNAVTAGTAVSIPTAFAAIALAPASVLDVMSAEINRLLVVGRSQEIIPIPVKVPRRNYIDFVDELFPMIRDTEPAQLGAEWLAGGDTEPELRSQDPKAQRTRVKKADVASASIPAASPPTPATPVASERTPETAPTPASTSPVAKEVTSEVPTSTPAPAPTPVTATPVPSPPAAQPAPSPTPSSTPALAVAPSASPPTPTPSVIAPFKTTAPQATPKATVAPSAPAPRWSRNFLSGSSPLLPAYDNLSCLSTSHPPDSLLLQATDKYIFFPISGAGGRIAVHPVEKKGRLPLQADFPCVSNGSEVVDFVVEEEDSERLVTAGEDGVVKVWVIPGGLEGALSEPELTIHPKGVDKVAKLVSNPAARHVLAVLSNDFGDGYVRIVNTKTGTVEDAIKIDGGGVYTAAWSPTGSHLAISCKDRQIRTLDPRNASSTLLSGPAHDSPRSFQLTWLDSTHLVSVGFSVGSLRKILLHRLSSANKSIETVSSLALDVSPSVLFPFFDPDTSILLLWGKGERTVSPFDVNLSLLPKPPFHRLPQFAGNLIHGWTFLPKRTVDVRKVEVLKALRLTSKTIEEVSFKIPRKNGEWFQDDVFPLTRGGPELGWEEWVGGKEGRKGGWVDLRPEGMKALSEAPKAAPVVKKKIEFGKKELTEAEKRAQSMDEMFAKAKMDDDDEADRIKGDEEWSD